VDREGQGSAEWDQATYWQRQVDSQGPEPSGPPLSAMPDLPDEVGPRPPRVGPAISVAVRVAMAITGLAIVGAILANSLGQGSTTLEAPPVVPPSVTSPLDLAPSPLAAPLSSAPDSPSASPAAPSPTPTPPARSNPPKSPPAPAPAIANPHTPQTVMLVSRVSGKAMQVRDAATSDGATIAQAAISGGKAQQWRLIEAGSGYFYIVNVNSGKALDTFGYSDDGDLVGQLTRYPDDQYQQWSFTSVGDGFYVVTNRISGRVLDLQGGGLDDTTPIQQWTAFPNNPNQQWLLRVLA
jgi:Ricin-type beta-trefoil lectin domain-like